jgi:RNA polymerase sigma-70 factor (ECF subfamily)
MMADVRAKAVPEGSGPAAEAPSNVVALERRRFVNDLYRACWGELCGWLRRRFGPGPPDPEDVAQTAFRKIAELDDVSVIQNPRAFLYTVAARTAVSGLRSRGRMEAFIDREFTEHGEEVEEITPERVYLEKERLAMVEQALAGLTERQREIVMRSRVMGQTYAQIAQETGWSMATISRQLEAAMIGISRTLAEREGGLS